MKIRAPAKINLGLRIVGRRDDGYHLLDTIMVPVSLYDEIEIHKERTSGGAVAARRLRLNVTCDHSAVPGGEENLAHRAAALVITHGGITEAIRIHIRKRIPVGAGLGGGSSDAAATLVGLNRLFKLGYSTQRLMRLGASLGADVPFFVRGTAARARGIGERLSSIETLPWRWALIVYPGFPVGTAWVYRNFQPKLTKPMSNNSIITLLKKPSGQRIILVNDLETVTLQRYPRIGFLKEKLIQQGAAGALMSGSGSAVFGLFDSRGKAAQAFSRLQKEEGVEAFLVRLLT